ncbi:MLX-interacting protein isoform X2 [Falco biarmicus]|uniref:MLX-interacting protein isoform X2 n=1 Tax=Falco rusticolus TaxID=120794 RepID=UPI0018869657|nr:MLX-interacting protein isoform X2 [Falco rusticolus]XP_055565891.1 MLX-interacting protein isoform X2 [Falco cherrug]XP_056186123.1 MLX-interacting protein isoform X2 [Falco biarmicus]
MAADVFMRPARLLGAAGPLSPRTEPDEDSSDTDDGGASPGGGRRCGPRRGQPPGPQIIHSGHFMVSSPHSEHPPKKGYDFDTVNEQTCQTYQFGAARGGGGAGGRLSIDASLTKLFECMSLAYSGKLVSPKWKNFKGLKLQWRDKIRLNNAIWRAWYMQYLEKRKNPVCHFVTPLDGSVDVDEHRRPEAIATWKRRIEIVIREYHKWRTYFKKRLQKHKDEDLSSLVRDDDVVLWQKRRYDRETPVPMEEGSLLDADMLISEFTDTLFSTLSSHQLVSWPNSRDIAHLGNADMIQPGLIPLQPNFDFMDTFESFQDIFMPSRSSNYFPSVSAVSSATTDSSSHSSQSPVLPSGSLPNTLPAGNISDGLIASSVPAPVIPDVGTDQCSSIRSGGSFIQSADFTPSSSLSGPQTFMPVFQTPLPLLQPATQQHQSPMPAVPLNSSLSSPPAAFAAPETQKFGLCESTVITHTASATLTHNAPATTFSRSQNLVLATQQPGAGVPCNLAFQTAVLQGQPRPQLQSQLTFALPKAVPLATAGTRPKQSQKIVPAPKPETVSLLLKNAFITPGRDCQNSGQASPCTSEQSPSPQSPQNSCSGKPATDPNMAALKNRRMKHISEQKRRYNIKIGFSTLNSLVSANSKLISHAITLQKTVEYISKLQQERTQIQEESRRLREEIEELNATIISCQQQLPATGIPITPQRFDHMRRMFDEYVRSRTLQNWKFWIFSIIIKPLFESFNGMVSTASFKDLDQTAMAWLDQHCSLPLLRPVVLNALRHLSTTTSILSDPSCLPEQAVEAVNKMNKTAGET